MLCRLGRMLREHKELIGGVMFVAGIVCVLGLASTDDYHTTLGEHDGFFLLMVKMAIAVACSVVGARISGMIGGEHE